MRFLLPAIALSIMATTMGCATCSNPLSCLLMEFRATDCCAMDCCAVDCCTECVTCEPSCCLLDCDACGPSCGSCGYEVVYEGPADTSAMASPSSCQGHSSTTTAVPTGIPTFAAPGNSTEPSDRQNSPAVTSDLRPSVPSSRSIVQPPTPPVPAPEPDRIKTTKPVKNFLPSVLTDEA